MPHIATISVPSISLTSLSKDLHPPCANFLHMLLGSVSALTTLAAAPPAGPSSSHSTERQSLHALRRASESTDSLIMSLDPAIDKGKAKADNPMPPAAIQMVGPVSLIPAPAGKESSVVAVKHIDGNVASVANSVSLLLLYFDEQRVEEIKRSMALSNKVDDMLFSLEKLSEQTGVGAGDSTTRPELADLVNSNNALVGVVEGLVESVNINTASLESL